MKPSYGQTQCFRVQPQVLSSTCDCLVLRPVSDARGVEIFSGLNTFTGMRRLHRIHINRCKTIESPYFAPEPRLEPPRVLSTPASSACPGLQDVGRNRYIYGRGAPPSFPRRLTEEYSTAMCLRDVLVRSNCGYKRSPRNAATVSSVPPGAS